MSCTNPVADTPDRTRLWLERGLFATLLLTCLLAMSHHKADPDFWGHVQYGRDVIQDGLPATTTYSYTTQDYRWINHENLSELLMAMGVDRFGPALLLGVKTLLALMLLMLVYQQGTREKVEAIPLYLCMLLVASNLMHSWTMRPQLLTYSLFTVMVALLTWVFASWPNRWPALLRGSEPTPLVWGALERRRLRWLWLLVPLFVIWTNGHGGFVAGFCILVAYLSLRCLELWMAQGRQAWSTIGRLAGLATAIGLATLLNPYGWRLHAWLLQSLGARRPEILEWLPPELFSPVWPAWWLLVAVFVSALLASRRRRDLTHLAILGLTLWQACEHRRHIAFFAILFGFWMPVHVQSLLLRLRGSRGAQPDGAASPRLRRALSVGLPLVLVGLLIGLYRHSCEIPVRRDSYPVSAFQYITDENLSGNLLLRFKWAQYAIAAFSVESPDRPHLKVAFDGRFRTCYPQELVDMYFDFAIGDAPPEMRCRSQFSPPVDGSRILRYKSPDLVLIDRAQTYSVQMMQENKEDWTLLYQDELAQLWGRSDKYGNPNSPQFVPPERRAVGDTPQEGYVAWPAMPTRQQARIQLVHTSSSDGQNEPGVTRSAAQQP